MNTKDKEIYKNLAKNLEKMVSVMELITKSIDEVHIRLDKINKKLNKSGGKNERKSSGNI